MKHFKITLDNGVTLYSKTSFMFGVDLQGVYAEYNGQKYYNTQQWTCFSDSNGVDIYENDFIQFNHNGFNMVDQIIFHHGQFITKNNIVPIKDLCKPNNKVFIK